MKVCPKCKAKYEESKKFCRKCGIAIVSEKAVAPDVVAKRQIFEININQNPQNVSLLGEYADYLSSVSLYEDALSQLLKALEIEPTNNIIRRKIVAIYDAKNDWDNAATQLLILIETHPTDIDLHDKLVSAYVFSGRLSEADEVLVNMLEHAPNNINFLTRRRDLLKKLGKIEDIISVCSQIVKLAPRDLSSWNLLADHLLETGKESEALSSFKSILTIDPASARANLYIGINQHDNNEFKEAIPLLDKASSGSKNLSSLEKDLANLYLYSSRLQSGSASLANIKLGQFNNWKHLDDRHFKTLHTCFMLRGDLEYKDGKLDEAIISFKASLEFLDDIEVKNRLAKAYVDKGDAFITKGNSFLAREAYDAGLNYLPDDSTLLSKRKSALTKQKRKKVFISSVVSVVVLIAAAIGSFIYYGQGIFDIHISPPAKISILKGDKVVVSSSLNKESENLITSFLRYGGYTLLLEKDGYERVEKSIKVGLGRKTKKINIKLNPSYGTFKVATIPKKAKVLIRNKYEDKTCITPCEISNIFAMQSTIEISLPGYTPFNTEKNIPAQQIIDLGTIVFKGSLWIDSNPSGGEVFINNKRQGNTPLQIDDLPAKRTKVEVRKKNVGAYVSNVEIQPGKTKDLGRVNFSKVGFLRVNSSPDGAKVWFDKKQVGVTPFDLESIKVGKHTLKIEYSDLLPYKKTLEFRPGELIDLGTIIFKGSLKIHSIPSGSEVFVNNVRQGVTPLNIDDLLAKPAIIEVRKNGFGIYSSRVTIEPEKVTDLGTVTLSKFGTISVSSMPDGAKVILDGNNVGLTPIVLSNLKIGNHHLNIGVLGYIPFEKNVTLKEGEFIDLGVISLLKFPTEEQLKSDIIYYYNTRGEWKGKFEIDYIDKMRIEDISDNNKKIHVRYKYKPLPGNRRSAGFDQRIFILRRIGDKYNISKMLGNNSARF